MRWSDLRTWEAMIDAATRLHDGVWPSRCASGSFPQRMTRCAEAHPRCLTLGFVHELPLRHGPRDQCIAPTVFDPSGSDGDCPRKVHDWRPSLSAQVSHTVSVSIATGTSSAVQAWMRDALADVAASGSPLSDVADIYLHDRDDAVTYEQVEALGSELLRRLHEQRPWAARPLARKVLATVRATC